jgi:hypothetical protein
MMLNPMHDLVVEALFVSDLQPSQTPGRDAVQSAVERMILSLGSDGCACSVAAEFGDHPDIAVRRMGWCHEIVDAIWPVSVPA